MDCFYSNLRTKVLLFCQKAFAESKKALSNRTKKLISLVWAGSAGGIGEA